MSCENRERVYGLMKILNASRPSEHPPVRGENVKIIMLLTHAFNVLSLKLKKLRRHNKSAIDLSNANPACGHKQVRRSTGHITVTTRYSDQQGSRS